MLSLNLDPYGLENFFMVSSLTYNCNCMMQTFCLSHKFVILVTCDGQNWKLSLDAKLYRIHAHVCLKAWFISRTLLVIKAHNHIRALKRQQQQVN